VTETRIEKESKDNPFVSASILSHFAVSFQLRARNFALSRNFEAMCYPLGQGYLISRILGRDERWIGDGDTIGEKRGQEVRAFD